MTREPLSARRRLLRGAVLLPILASGGTFALWIMSKIPSLADRLGWPGPVVALVLGLLAIGPVWLAGETLANRLLVLLGLPKLGATDVTPVPGTPRADSPTGPGDAEC